ncbi:MAG: bifunctional (p)ppGpp synthetase/guanosine-3',5'-bis(diphosphate) 3'-pyrophosphohydrolase [Alphaproteobacteria bacterium]|nr:bifunctional (p)ppGpp synthetase/guanosine-3',5'-bis(diphosphate) 3'-pyrophosphohydrolase [Alphaproteobacteria bacterium]
MDYQKPCQYSIRLIDRLKSLDSQNVLDFDLINKAIYWAKKYHGEQKRKSGEPYYSHPLEVAYMISDYKLKTDVIVASILHDIIEDTPVTAGMILDTFSWRIAEMVDRLTRDRLDRTKLSVEEIINNAYKNRDREVLLIKLFDRLHNLSTLSSLILQKQLCTKLETISIFPLLCIFLDSIDFDELLTCSLSSEKNSFNLFINEFYQQSGAGCLVSNQFIEMIKS